MVEVWKDIKGFENRYKISNLGRVKSLKRKSTFGHSYKITPERILKLHKDRTGYLRVYLTKNSKKYYRRVHQLVAEHFLKKPNKKFIVDHINENKLDNTLSNLQYISTRENISKTYRKTRKTQSKYTGVSRTTNGKKWRSRITVDGKEKLLGYYDTEIEASIAYQKALKELI